MSIENIFIRLNTQIQNMTKFSEVACFESYFNMRSTASRADIKIEISQELEKLILKKKQLNKTKKNINQIKKLMDAKKSLNRVNLPQGNFYGNDKFLQEIKTSSGSPTGIVSSDLPQLQVWIQQLSFKAKQQYFLSKISPYMPIFESISTYLDTLRDSITLESIDSNENGLVNYQLNPSFRHDCIQLQLPQKFNLYPNLTSNKYTVNIQFSSLFNNVNARKKIKFKMGISQQ
jgi:cell division FtsZ-interacting protein ZapD